MTELDITDEMADQGAEALRGYPIAASDLIDAASEVLQAAGGGLIATELRVQAYRLRQRSDNTLMTRDGSGQERVATLRQIADELVARAAELDGGAS